VFKNLEKSDCKEAFKVFFFDYGLIILIDMIIILN